MLFFRELLVTISMAVPVKVILPITVVLEVQVALSQKLRMNGNKKILRKGTKKERIDFLYNRYSQEVDQSQVAPRLK